MTMGSMATDEKGLRIIYNSMPKEELEYRLVRAGKHNTLETCQYLLAQMADRGYAVGPPGWDSLVQVFHRWYRYYRKVSYVRA